MPKNRITLCTADLEQNACDASLAKEKIARSNPPYDVVIHSVRKRLADADGISCKAVLDAIVKAGVLPDDSPKYVKSVTFTQEKGDEEKTIISLNGQSKIEAWY